MNRAVNHFAKNDAFEESQFLNEVLENPDLIPELTTTANRFFADGEKEFNVEPIQEQEIRDYYREDAFIWSFLSSARRFDRFLYRKILRREYPYILPGKVKR